jgi:hypothetical protein
MNKPLKFLSLLVGITLCSSACSAWVVQARSEESAAPKAFLYQTMLGKSVSDKEVADFIAINNCTPSGQFQVCQSAGIALWTDMDQIVRTVYLYVNNSDGFAPYQGELPYGLKFYDIMGAVEYKLAKLDEKHGLQTTSKPGLPDEGSTPDHFHYWAVYKRYGMIIVYNSPYADEDASIHSILISKWSHISSR